MAKSNNVIIIKKIHRHEGHHGGAWKVAYADFVTAMMAFFLVMWIVGQNEEIKEHVASYFLDPIGYNEKLKAGLLDGSAGLLEEQSSTPTVFEKNPQGIMDESLKGLLEQTGQEILAALLEIPDLQGLAELIDVDLTSEGLRIELQEASESTFFDLGSPNLSPNGLKAVQAIGTVIAHLNMDVAVEGHTDSRPFAAESGPYTNWELSADRANSARRVLSDSGVDPKHITEIRGYADTNLKYPDNPLDSRNRRITIIVFNRILQERSMDVNNGETPGDIMDTLNGHD